MQSRGEEITSGSEASFTSGKIERVPHLFDYPDSPNPVLTGIRLLQQLPPDGDWNLRLHRLLK